MLTLHTQTHIQDNGSYTCILIHIISILYINGLQKLNRFPVWPLIGERLDISPINGQSHFAINAIDMLNCNWVSVEWYDFKMQTQRSENVSQLWVLNVLVIYIYYCFHQSFDFIELALMLDVYPQSE